MKRVAVFISVLFLFFNVLPSESKNLKALFSYARFYSTNDGPFIETYLSVSGNSVNFIKNKDGLFQATINVSINVKNETGVAVHNDNYNLVSPAIADTIHTSFNFIDQQRILLAKGSYILELTIADKNGSGKTFTSSDSVKIDFNSFHINISDLVMIDSYKKSEKENSLSKSGYDLVPFVDNFFPKTIKSLKFYAEVYNASEVLGNATPYLLSYHIENYENKQILDDYSVSKKQNAEGVSVILSEFDISQLPSGNYKLVVELRDKNNQLLGFNETYFQRSNMEATLSQGKIENIRIENTFVSKITNHDELVENVACLHPICNAEESIWLENQLKLADSKLSRQSPDARGENSNLPGEVASHDQLKVANDKLMQQFFYDFWYRRNPVDPEKAWKDYSIEVAKAQKLYGNKFLKGYDSERGRVFLQYGLANAIEKHDHEPDAYPYEIWQYYKIKNQTNRKFVFYNPDIVGEDFRLLHSDMPGEISNANWSMALYKRNSQSNNMDVEKRKQFIGNQSQDAFDQPK